MGNTCYRTIVTGLLLRGMYGEHMLQDNCYGTIVKGNVWGTNVLQVQTLGENQMLWGVIVRGTYFMGKQRLYYYPVQEL